ncbi:MAG: (2Fe-2S)-binding protein [Deltaproteobacteria bacterium]|nr:(2Fe-2S)-binding protein [Deltaproteobacteria bacterium]
MPNIQLTINGKPIDAEVEPQTTLLDFLRESMDLTGAKRGCDVGDCGACTVLLDGKPVNACLVLVIRLQGRHVDTVESLMQNNGLHPLQKAFVENGALQCGYCGAGMLMSAKALLEETPKPNETQVRTALAGNLCRCSGYTKIVEAVHCVGRDMALDSEENR